MFVNKHISRAHISKSKRCFNVKSSTYYFHMKTKILADFQICISVPLTELWKVRLVYGRQKTKYKSGTFTYTIRNLCFNSLFKNRFQDFLNVERIECSISKAAMSSH